MMDEYCRIVASGEAGDYFQFMKEAEWCRLRRILSHVPTLYMISMNSIIFPRLQCYPAAISPYDVMLDNHDGVSVAKGEGFKGGPLFEAVFSLSRGRRKKCQKKWVSHLKVAEASLLRALRTRNVNSGPPSRV